MTLNLSDESIFKINLIAPTILLPVTILLHSGLPWLLISLTLVYISFFKHGFRFLRNSLSILAITTLFFTLIVLYSGLYSFNIRVTDYYYDFVTQGLINIYLISNVKDYKKVVNSSLKFHFFLFISTCFNLLLLINGMINYMVFGFNLALCFFFTCVNLFFTQRGLKFYFYSLFLILYFIMVFLLGNRGSLLICIVLFITNFLLTNRISKLVKVLNVISILFVFLFLYVNFGELVDWLISLSSDLGYYSTPLHKLKYLYEHGVSDASSGRDVIYINALDYIERSNLVPTGVSSFYATYNVTSPHNIILDIIIAFGFLSPLFILLIFISIFIYFFKVTKESFYCESIFLINILMFVLVKLFLSSSFMSEPLFYIMFYFCVGVFFKLREVLGEK